MTRFHCFPSYIWNHNLNKDLFHSTANHLQLPRLFQLRPACLLFPRQTLLHPHWPRPFLKGMALRLSPWQPIQGHRIAHQGHRPWQATVAHHIGPCLLTLFPPLQLQMHPQICRRMVLWTQTNLTRTTDFYINRTSQNFRSVHVFCDCGYFDSTGCRLLLKVNVVLHFWTAVDIGTLYITS